LPLDQGETITTIMPLPEDEALWSNLHVMFSTRSGGARRNDLSDFVQVNRNGKIAMKLDEDDVLVDVHICTEDDDILLTTAKGRCIRFPVTAIRVFVGRNSTGVRGIRLGKDDMVISMCVIRHMDAEPGERIAYLKKRRAMEGNGDVQDLVDSETDEDDAGEDVDISTERYIELSAAEQFVLSISENGYGKRTSTYEYRASGRGGKGIIAMVTNSRNGDLVASFPVEESDQIMLVTDGGQLIRCPVQHISLLGRSTQGVTVFDTADDEKVVSVSRVSDAGDDDETDEDGEDDVNPDNDTQEN